MDNTQQPEGPRGGSTPGTPEGGRAQRRRRPPLAVASVVAAVLVVAGGGTYLAVGTSGGGGSDAKPPLTVGTAYHPIGSAGPSPSRVQVPPRGMKPGGGTGASGAAPGGAASLSYTTHGRDLTLRFYGGVCGEYTLSADESGPAVKVRLEKPTPKPGEACMALAKRLTKTVTLKRPLGDRKVISAATGAEVPRAGS